MKKALKIIITLIIVASLITGYVFYMNGQKTIYNKENAIGNTAGNLNNGGLFCEYDNKIYFANPYDNNRLYVMNSDCSNAKKLNDDSVAYINVCGNYIYYVRNNFSKETIGMVFRGQLYGVYRTNLKGKRVKALYSKPSGTISLCGNTIYYEHYDNSTAFSLYKVNIDGTNNVKLYDTAYSPSNAKDGRLYFSDPSNKNNICYIDTKTDEKKTYYDCNSYMADAEGNYIYYIDLSKNYSLVRLNTSNKTLELLYSGDNGKVINYNVYGNKIFFQVEGNEQDGLYRMNIDGTQLEQIAMGNITNIHCTSQYTFFQYFDNQGALYRISTSGPISQVEQITIKKN